MRKLLASLYNKENNEELYVFNVTHTICIIGMIVICAIAGFFFEDHRAVYLSFGICVLFFLTMAEANRTLKIKRCVIIMSVVFNFIYLPEIFYYFDRNISVIPVYFLFGVTY